MQYSVSDEIASFIARVEESVCQIKQANGDAPEKNGINKNFDLFTRVLQTLYFCIGVCF